MFQRLCLTAIVMIYLVVLAGGIVRMTGSGMGCPDWPRCFGQWIPPTDVSQLPSDYLHFYSAHLLGKGEAVVFNVEKAWIEYLNRLVGALLGLVVFAAFILSFRYWKKDRTLIFVMFIALILIGLNGVLGKYVVDSYLKSYLITLHMLIAILPIGVLLYATARAYSGEVRVPNLAQKDTLNRWLVASMALTLLQILLGTQVREAMDHVILAFGPDRSQWIENLGLSFVIHRSFSWVVMGANFYFVWKFKQNNPSTGLLNNYVRALAALLLIEFASGVGMVYAGVPAFLQPLHLFLALIALGLQFVIWLLIHKARIFASSRAAQPVAAR
jgi:heme a synthase